MEHLKGVSHLAGSVIAFFLAPPPPRYLRTDDDRIHGLSRTQYIALMDILHSLCYLLDVSSEVAFSSLKSAQVGATHMPNVPRPPPPGAYRCLPS